MANVLLDEIAKRERNIAEYNDKAERVDALKAEIAEKEAEIARLDNELANTNPDTLREEIEYLTSVAIRVGVIDPPNVDENETAPTVEPIAENPQEI